MSIPELYPNSVNTLAPRASSSGWARPRSAAPPAADSEGPAAPAPDPGPGPGPGRTFVALQDILVRLHELLLLAAVGRLLTRHVASHGRPRRALPGLRPTPVPGPARRGGDGPSLGPLCGWGPAAAPSLSALRPLLPAWQSVAFRSSARSQPAGPGSRFRLPSPRLRSSLSPPRRGGGGSSCQERQARPVPRPSRRRPARPRPGLRLAGPGLPTRGAR